MVRCRLDSPLVIWNDIVQLGCNSWGKKSLHGLICRLVFGSVVYNIWHTRNDIRHDGVLKNKEQLLKHIFWEIRSRVAGVKIFPRTKENALLCYLWNLPAGILA
jgi:hypothetical protein